jgi:3-oxoacyl-[acyl-carrier-protein] synthase III
MIKPRFYSARLVGTGRAAPEGRLTNADLEKMVQTNDDWIVSRTGIRERRIAGAHDTTASLAAAAGRAALRRAGLQAKDLDLLIVATLTPDVLRFSVHVDADVELIAAFKQAGHGRDLLRRKGLKTKPHECRLCMKGTSTGEV